VNLLTDPIIRMDFAITAGSRQRRDSGSHGSRSVMARLCFVGGFGVFYEIHEKDLWGYALHSILRISSRLKSSTAT